MPRIRCHYLDCTFLKEKFCSAAAIELDPDSGCLTYTIADAEDQADIDQVDEWDEMLDDDDNEDTKLYEDDDELSTDWDDDDD